MCNMLLLLLLLPFVETWGGGRDGEGHDGEGHDDDDDDRDNAADAALIIYELKYFDKYV